MGLNEAIQHWSTAAANLGAKTEKEPLEKKNEQDKLDSSSSL